MTNRRTEMRRGAADRARRNARWGMLMPAGRGGPRWPKRRAES